MADKSSLGNRMKGYENVSRTYLTRRLPVIIRIDGKAFHSFTRGMRRPFDDVLISSMHDTAKYLCENIMGCKIAYVQSDEISLLLTDYDNLDTQAWFDKNIQKMVSVSASMATMAFNRAFRESAENFGSYFKCKYEDKEQFITYLRKLDSAMFDSRVFTLPKEEVTNYFIWRQQDATRNAIQMVGQAHFSHSQLQGKNCNQIQEMLWQGHKVNFNDLPTHYKRGACIVKETYMLDNAERSRWVVDYDIPVFTSARNYIENYV